MDDNSLMPFGKHKGEKLANVPDSYLLYIYQQGWAKGPLKKYIEENLDSIEPSMPNAECDATESDIY